jgi:anti-anti-sigma regulatory factor
MQVIVGGTARASLQAARLEGKMLTVGIENIGEMAVIECRGRIVRSEAAFKLREAVKSQSDACTIVLDLSKVSAIEGGGLGMLVFLQRWARDHDIQLRLFNPCKSVCDRLKHAGATSGFDFASLDEVVALGAPQALDSRVGAAG